MYEHLTHVTCKSVIIRDFVELSVISVSAMFSFVKLCLVSVCLHL